MNEVRAPSEGDGGVRLTVASEAFYPTLYQRLCDMIDSGVEIYNSWKDTANGAISFIDWAISHGFDRNHRYLWKYDEKIEFCPENCCWLTANDFEIRTKIRWEEKNHSSKKSITSDDCCKRIDNQTIIDPDIGGTLSV